MSVVTLLPSVVSLEFKVSLYEEVKILKDYGIHSSLFKWHIQTLLLPLPSGFLTRNGTVQRGGIIDRISCQPKEVLQGRNGCNH